MASYNFVFAAIVALAMLTCKCRADLINDVCVQSQNSTFCNDVLRSESDEPRSKSPLTYKLLAEIAIEKAQKMTQEISDVAKSVETAENKVATESCVLILHVAMGVLQGSTNLVRFVNNKETQKVLDVDVLTAWGVSISCDNMFESVPQPPELKQATKNFQDLILVTRTIISKLV